MNDLMQLYDTWHAVKAIKRNDSAKRVYELVGPVCESADVLAKDRLVLTRRFNCVMDAGAYGSVMSSNYNSRLKAPEILVRFFFKTHQRRESYEDSIALEKDL